MFFCDAGRAGLDFVQVFYYDGKFNLYFKFTISKINTRDKFFHPDLHSSSQLQ